MHDPAQFLIPLEFLDRDDQNISCHSQQALSTRSKFMVSQPWVKGTELSAPWTEGAGVPAQRPLMARDAIHCVTAWKLSAHSTADWMCFDN